MRSTKIKPYESSSVTSAKPQLRGPRGVAKRLARSRYDYLERRLGFDIGDRMQRLDLAWLEGAVGLVTEEG